jgi:hypothetical protein
MGGCLLFVSYDIDFFVPIRNRAVIGIVVLFYRRVSHG